MLLVNIVASRNMIKMQVIVNIAEKLFILKMIEKQLHKKH
jgi:hypothetical protein